MPTSDNPRIRVLAPTTAGPVYLDVAATLGLRQEPLVQLLGARRLDLGPSVQAAAGAVDAAHGPEGERIAAYWVTASGAEPASGRSAELAALVAVLIARREQRVHRDVTLAVSGVLQLVDGRVRVGAVEGWPDKLATLPPVDELWVPADQIHEIAARYDGVVIGIAAPEDAETALEPWLQPRPEPWPGAARAHPLAADVLARAAGRAREDGRGYLALADVAVELGLPPGPPPPRFKAGSDLPAPSHAVRHLPLRDGFRRQDLAGEVVTAFRELWGDQVQPRDTDTDVAAPPRALIVGAGPSEGQRLEPRPGQTVGRFRSDPERCPDIALFEDRSIGWDPAVHARHLEWVGAGQIRALYPVNVRRGGWGPTLRTPGDVVIDLAVGDVIELSAHTWLRAAP